MELRERSATEILGRLAQENSAVGESLQVLTFRAGETVSKATDMTKSVFLVAGGRVQLYRTSSGGRRFVIATLRPGSIFGEASLLGGDEPDTYAVAMDPCMIWAMPRQRAMEISSSEAMFGFGLMQAMGQRVVEAENRLEQVAYRTLASRLAALLLELAGDDSQGIVHATHEELAGMLGTWRETISKTLQVLRRRGLVASGHRQLSLLDREGLEREAGIIR